MPIRYRCPQCNQLLSVSTRKAGHPTKCPTCGAAHNIPAAERPTVEPGDDQSTVTMSPAPPVKSEQKSKKTSVPPSAVTAPAVGASTVAAPTAAGSGVAARTVASPALPVSTVRVPSAPELSAIGEVDDRAQNWADDSEEDEGLAIQAIERKSDELDLIPMVDCVFLLLVFYMITASYALQKTISFAPPSSDKKGAVQAAPSPEDQTQSSIIVQIDARNRILVDDVPLANVADLPDVLRAKMNGEQKNELVIEADPQALHETEVAVVDAANDLQFQRVRMAVTAADTD